MSAAEFLIIHIALFLFVISGFFLRLEKEDKPNKSDEHNIVQEEERTP